ARADIPLLRRELVLQALELSVPRTDELQLCLDAAERLSEVALLGHQETPQVVQRDAEEVAQLDELAKPLDVAVAVEAVPALLPLRAAEQTELLVVANRARGDTGLFRNLADPVDALAHTRLFCSP